ncbi:MAG: IclR family transcriptional regulator [Deltaproteobacteria bacterium]|nr:IclR family transcriptional regulator [Deltaproteobacteria bacterium]
MKLNNKQNYKTLKDLAKILSLFNDIKADEKSVTEISKALEMFPSKVSRMLRTLEGEGLFEKNLESGKYRLGILFFELGVVYAYHHSLRKIIRPHIEQIAQEINVTVSWAILKKNRVIVLDRIQNLPIDALAYRIGLNLPVHTTSVGKILMAYLPEEEQDKILRSVDLVKSTEASVIDPKIIKERLKLYREEGYSTDEEETYEGVNCIAVPIKNADGKVIAAVSLMDDKSRTSRELLFRHLDYLKEKALFISRQLGYRSF